MSFPRYPRYKDSGVDWLGQVPVHWAAKKIGAISSLKGRLGWQGLKADEYRDEGPYVVSSAHFDNHRILWDKCPRVSQERYDTDNNIQLAVDDLLLMKDGAAMGKLAFVDHLPGPACLNSHLLLFRPIKTDGIEAYCPRFAFYFMQTGYFQEHIKVNGTGATFLGVSQETIGRYPLVLPPLVEQAAIAAFLERETAKIDELVSEQRRLMELLKEKRQAVISHAVTRGLNPAVPLKPSGIEWLGDVPKHWEFGPLKRYWSVTDCKHVTAEFVEDGIPLASIREVQSRWVALENAKCTTEHFYELLIEGGRHPVPGDLIFSRNATVGEVAQVHADHPRFAMGQDVVLLRKLSPDYASDFLQHVIRSPIIIQQLANMMIGSTFKRINVEEIRSFAVPSPPSNEQAEIAAFLENEVTKYDTLAAEAQRAIDLLQERRTALISSAVTGQIDVRQIKY